MEIEIFFIVRSQMKCPELNINKIFQVFSLDFPLLDTKVGLPSLNPFTIGYVLLNKEKSYFVKGLLKKMFDNV